MAGSSQRETLRLAGRPPPGRPDGNSFRRAENSARPYGYMETWAVSYMVEAGLPIPLRQRVKGIGQGFSARCYAVPSTLAGSTFTPGPIVEVMATRWM